VAHAEIKKHAILSDLLPDTDWKNDGYYAYQGGLTTSPCTDDVNWIILKAKGKISANQVTKLRQLRDDDDDKIKQNWREIVDNPNPVFGCFDDTDSPTENPTELPSVQPSDDPTENPSVMPTEMPSEDPTMDPSYDPTGIPTDTPEDASSDSSSSSSSDRLARRIDSSRQGNRVWWSHHEGRRNKNKHKAVD